MFRSLHIAASGMAAQESNLDAISNNIANGSTAGYKKQRADFQDLLYQTIRAAGTQTSATATTPSGLQVGNGVRVVGMSRSFSQGSTTVTNNPLDVAIEGEGFFVVQQADGTPAYTRAGNFQTNAQGQIVTSEGYPIDPAITIPPDATSVTIGADGTVSVTNGTQTTPTQVGQITTATFVNPAGLTAFGHNLYKESAASGNPQVGVAGTESRGSLLQGSIENSNVDVVEEMVGLINAQRGYEINSKVISAADEMLQSATQLR
ncbi:MAG TPA: flagellar basal-body rod protein FlgG [Polyangiaceae bacterium]|nr:flagellar basal-body rod protein FlgG [Polyangiaceae bacterium]